jgi:4-hydroxy-2-oxoheptanedioate aldolase
LIEDYEGVEKCEEIIKTPGIDAIDIGPYDLAQSMGVPDWKDVEEAYERIIRTAVKYNMPVQLGTANNYRNPEMVRKYVEMGCRIFSFGGFFGHGVSECFKFVDTLRDEYKI